MNYKNKINLNSLRLDTKEFGIKRKITFNDLFLVENKIDRGKFHTITLDEYRRLLKMKVKLPEDFNRRFMIIR